MAKLLLAVLLVPGLALAAAGSPDAHFYRSLAEGGNAEVRLGNLAAQKAESQSVRDFAAMMVKDHSAANAQLRTLAASKNVAVPKGPGTVADAKIVELKALSGSTFDKSYVSNQISAHQSTVSLLQKEIDSGKDPDAKAFAHKVLPTVQSHLNAIEKIADQMGIKYS
jgi:putative membrane protein